MEINKNFAVAGSSLLLVIFLVVLKIFGLLFLLPWEVYLIINGTLPLTVLLLLLLALIALMTNKSNRNSERVVSGVVIIGLLVIIGGIFVPILFFEAFIHNQGQGITQYSLSVSGLEGKDGELFGEITVPLPVQGDESLFPARKMDNQTFGEWHTRVRELPGSKGNVLVFRHDGPDLTDIDAEFYDYLPKGLIVDNDNKIFLSPAPDGPESLIMAGRFAWSPKTSLNPYDFSYQSVVSLQGTPVNMSGFSGDEIEIHILLNVYTGKTGFMTVPATYRFTIDESLSLNDSGYYPVTVNVHVS